MTDDPVVAAKSALRARLLADRRAGTPRAHAADAAALAGHLEALAGQRDTVCAYVPVGSEPGSPAMLAKLARRGVKVLVPVVRTEDDGAPLALWWGRYQPDSLISARFGLLEPPAPWLPPETLAEAELIVVPAVAVDRRGMRLGRGAGFYDRSLHWRRPQVPLVAVVRDAELLDAVPAEAHDVPMTHALTPRLGLVPLG